MEQARISEINGGAYFDSFGRKLVKIGNMNVNAGDVVWTDGRCIYGNIMHGNPARPHTFISGGVDGIPICSPKGFFLFDKRTAKVNKSYKLNADFQFLSFVNNEGNFYIAISDSKYPYNTGKWYKVTAKEYVEVGDYKMIMDGQVSSSGQLLTLLNGGNDGLYTNCKLTHAWPGWNQIAPQAQNEVMALARTLKKASGEGSECDNFGPSWRSSFLYGWSGRIYDDDTFYGVHENEIVGHTNIPWEYKISKDIKVVMAVGLTQNQQILYNKGSLSFFNPFWTARTGGYNNNGSGMRLAPNFIYDDEPKLIETWNQGSNYGNWCMIMRIEDPYIQAEPFKTQGGYGIIVFQRQEGLVANKDGGYNQVDISGRSLSNYASGNEKTTDEIVIERYNKMWRNTLQYPDENLGYGLQQIQEALIELTPDYIPGFGFHAKDNSQAYKKTRYIYDFPLNGSWECTYNGTNQTITGPGGSLYTGSVAKTAYIYKLKDNKKDNIHLILNGTNLMVNTNGKNYLCRNVYNTRIAYMPGIMGYVHQLQKLVQSLGGSLKG